jgi:Zn-dependent protease with chaperone function
MDERDVEDKTDPAGEGPAGQLTEESQASLIGDEDQPQPEPAEDALLPPIRPTPPLPPGAQPAGSAPSPSTQSRPGAPPPKSGAPPKPGQPKSGSQAVVGFMSRGPVKCTYLKEISYKSFAYPSDDEALEAVKRIPGVPRLFDWIIDNFLEEYLALYHLYNATRCTPKQYAAIYDLVGKCAKVLDCPMPEVYVSFTTGFNAMTSGVDRTFMVIGSRVVDIFPREDLMFIIGHELGHIKANHVLYKTVMRFIVEFFPVLQSLIPFNVGLLYRPLLLALAEWDRRSEFTSDRAGLLCCQHPQAAFAALSWFAGKLRRFENEYAPQLLDEQVSEIRESGNKLARLALFLSSMQQSHPYSVLRVAELRQWYRSGAYQRILDGEYIRDPFGEHEAGRRKPCPGCRREVNSKLDWCPYCHAPLRPQKPGSAPPTGPAAPPTKPCVKCGAAVPVNARFCLNCGQPMH